MNKGNNVIDLGSRRLQKSALQSNASPPAPILDMTERRQEMITHERREVRRTILSEFIGAFIVVPQRGLQRVAIYDISESGLAFDIEHGVGKLSIGEEVAMRVYMNQKTYFQFIARISNARDLGEEAVSRHGCNFIKGTINDVALHHFVKFIENVSASLQTDHGDVMVSNLGNR